MILYITPYQNLPDHHDLVVYTIDTIGNSTSGELDDLPDDAAEAIIAAIIRVEDNPTPAKRP